ncbi:MAG: metalloregulator ArsR/SmtB family transcription factor [Acidobacteriaceae bacterium]
MAMKTPMGNASCELLGGFFAIFAHATRMRIFCALYGEPKTVTEIAKYAEVSIANASQHLRLMRDRGAVVAEKRAQSVYYRVADPRFVEAVLLIRATLLEGMKKSTAQAALPARRRARVLQTA